MRKIDPDRSGRLSQGKVLGAALVLAAAISLQSCTKVDLNSYPSPSGEVVVLQRFTDNFGSYTDEFWFEVDSLDLKVPLAYFRHGTAKVHWKDDSTLEFCGSDLTPYLMQSFDVSTSTGPRRIRVVQTCKPVGIGIP